MQTRRFGGFCYFGVLSLAASRIWSRARGQVRVPRERARCCERPQELVSLCRLLQIVAPGRPSWAPLTAVHVEPPDIAEQSFERLIGFVRLLGMGPPASLDHLRQVLGVPPAVFGTPN